MDSPAKLTSLFECIFGTIPETTSIMQLSIIGERFSEIPYENLTKIIRAYTMDEPESRMRRPVEILMDYQRYRTGGTCFALTNCFRDILKGYGYDTWTHMADLGNGRNNHCALSLSLNDRRFLLDPGYLITHPLPLPDTGSIIHNTRLYPVRLEYDPLMGGYYLSTLEPQGEKFRYCLKKTPCDEQSFKRFWMDSFSWPMMNSILITRFDSQGRLYVHDRYLRLESMSNKSTKKIKENYDTILSNITGINCDIITKARLYLSEFKRKLREN
ncbi:arylamine N-acetyltransferase [bacterium]|nr:arylamine N-acetyltransferase [candidate division CSSED10-310 bacterium]